MERSQLDQFTHDATNHPPKDSTVIDAFEALRDAAVEFAAVIYDTTPRSREQSLAVTNLEQALMWARAAVARHQND